MTDTDPLPVQTPNEPRPEDGDQSDVSQDPDVSYEPPDGDDSDVDPDLETEDAE
jgi:hypothetical protein